MNREYFYFLVSRKLSGEATEEEKMALSEFLEQEDLKDLYGWIKEEWFTNKLEVNTSHYDYNKAFSAMVDGIRDHEPEFGSGVKQRKTKSLSRVWAVAASLLILSAVGMTMFLLLNSHRSTSDHALDWQEYTTQKGQHINIRLPDGSKVVVNGNSKIRFPKIFSDDKREVHIVGEAFFEVKKDPEKPFLVGLEDYQVRVLGTTFNVNAYPNHASISVALVEGSVTVGHKDSVDKVVLKPRYQVMFDKKNCLSSISEFDLKEITGWQQRIFVFKNEKLTDVLGQLENNYPITFHYDPVTLEGCRVNAEFNDESIWTILEALKYATGMDYQVDSQNQITLSGNGCR